MPVFVRVDVLLSAAKTQVLQVSGFSIFHPGHDVVVKPFPIGRRPPSKKYVQSAQDGPDAVHGCRRTHRVRTQHDL